MYVHLPISSLTLREFARSKFQPDCQVFKASRAWLQKLVNVETHLNYTFFLLATLFFQLSLSVA